MSAEAVCCFSPGALKKKLQHGHFSWVAGFTQPRYNSIQMSFERVKNELLYMCILSSLWFYGSSTLLFQAMGGRLSQRSSENHRGKIFLKKNISAFYQSAVILAHEAPTTLSNTEHFQQVQLRQSITLKVLLLVLFGRSTSNCGRSLRIHACVYNTDASWNFSFYL